MAIGGYNFGNNPHHYYNPSTNQLILYLQISKVMGVPLSHPSQTMTSY